MHAGRLVLVLLAALGVIGCASARLEKLDATLRAYERAIRWSEFKTAFVLANQPNAPMPDFQRLKDVRVTSYDKHGEPRADADGTRLTQTVEIRYVNINNMSERALNDQQQWVYVEKDKLWKLVSPFPVFK